MSKKKQKNKKQQQYQQQPNAVRTDELVVNICSIRTLAFYSQMVEETL